jgi:hypothetical protein
MQRLIFYLFRNIIIAIINQKKWLILLENQQRTVRYEKITKKSKNLKKLFWQT